MSWLQQIGFKGFSGGSAAELPEIWPMDLACNTFVEVDVQTIYSRILTDVFSRTHGLKDEYTPALFDNCLAGESPEGLTTLLSKAMATKAELFLVYDKGTKVIRKATSEEEKKIKAEVKARSESSTGIFVTFKDYRRTDLIKFYSTLEYLAVSGLYKTMNLAKAIQLKLKDLRGSVGAADAGDIAKQATAIAEALQKGKDVAMDGEDSIVTTTADLTPTKTAMEFIGEKRAFYLGLPASYVTGMAPAGLGDSGKGDAKAVERGLAPYFYAIGKPVLEGLFKASGLTFETEDTDYIEAGLNVLKTMEVTGTEFISKENKTKLVNVAFGLPEDAEGDPQPDPVAPPPAAPGAPAPQANPAAPPSAPGQPGA